MKFNVPKITRVLNAGDYAAELSEVKICVWVNPPKSLLKRHDAMIDRFVAALRWQMAGSAAPNPLPLPEAGRGAESDVPNLAVDETLKEMREIYADLWSAGPDVETHWSAAEIETLIMGMFETDPQLWPWLRSRTIEMIREHREAVKKV